MKKLILFLLLCLCSLSLIIVSVPIMEDLTAKGENFNSTVEYSQNGINVIQQPGFGGGLVIRLDDSLTQLEYGNASWGYFTKSKENNGVTQLSGICMRIHSDYDDIGIGFASNGIQTIIQIIDVSGYTDKILFTQRELYPGELLTAFEVAIRVYNNTH